MKFAYMAEKGSVVICVAKFCSQGRQGIAASVGLGASDILELDRFCIHNKHNEANLGSFLMSKFIKKVKKDYPQVKAIVSFADPAHGHHGGLYQASNWKLVGKTSSSYYYEAPDGGTIKKKAFYNFLKKHTKPQGMSEAQIAREMGLQKVKTPPKWKYLYSFDRS